jgi:hypothetical protein
MAAHLEYRWIENKDMAVAFVESKHFIFAKPLTYHGT